MNTDIQIFRNPVFGEIRTAGTSEQPLFCLADLCRAVELTNPSSVKSRLDEGDVQLIDLHALNYTEGGGNSMANFVNESGFYDVLLQSSSPKVKPFRKWVTSEVLPSIRRTGAYATPATIDAIIADPEFGIQLLSTLKEERRMRLEAEREAGVAEQKSRMLEGEKELLQFTVDTQTKELELQTPKVEYFDKCLDSKGYLTANMIAAELGISHIKLNRLLCEWQIQYRQSECYFLHSRYRDKGYTVHRPHPYTDSQGNVKTRQHMYWTEKGKKFIVELYRKKIAA